MEHVYPESVDKIDIKKAANSTEFVARVFVTRPTKLANE